jgi:hypothetical protein
MHSQALGKQRTREPRRSSAFLRQTNVQWKGRDEECLSRGVVRKEEASAMNGHSNKSRAGELEMNRTESEDNFSEPQLFERRKIPCTDLALLFSAYTRHRLVEALVNTSVLLQSPVEASGLNLLPRCTAGGRKGT